MQWKPGAFIQSEMGHFLPRCFLSPSRVHPVRFHLLSGGTFSSSLRMGRFWAGAMISEGRSVWARVVILSRLRLVRAHAMIGNKSRLQPLIRSPSPVTARFGHGG